MSKKTAIFYREESIKVFRDENKKEYLCCPVCGKLYEKYLVTLNTDNTGEYPKTKCNKCTLEYDGAHEVVEQIHKLVNR